MISLDTNVLLRRLLADDPEQTQAANRLFDGNQLLLITDVVLVETIWTLRGKRYNLDKAGIVQVVTSLLQEPKVVFESAQAIWEALNDYTEAQPVKTTSGSKSADFPDALIVAKSRQVAAGMQETLEAVYTFDQGALQISGTRRPAL